MQALIIRSAATQTHLSKWPYRMRRRVSCDAYPRTSPIVPFRWVKACRRSSRPHRLPLHVSYSYTTNSRPTMPDSTLSIASKAPSTNAPMRIPESVASTKEGQVSASVELSVVPKTTSFAARRPSALLTLSREWFHSPAKYSATSDAIDLSAHGWPSLDLTSAQYKLPQELR